MTFLSQTERELRRLRRLRITAFVLLGLIICLLLDEPVFHAIVPVVPFDQLDPPRAERLGPDAIVVDKMRYEILDWYRLLRVIGYAPTWLAVAAALWLVDRRSSPRSPGKEPRRRALALAVPVLVAGIAAEFAKLVVGKERPIDGSLFTGGELRVFLGGFADSSNLGFPSSHTAVAFAGAAGAAILWRAGAPVFYLLAAGCGLTRLLSGAHWLSDVFGGAVVGIVVAQLIARSLAGDTIDTRRTGRIA